MRQTRRRGDAAGIFILIILIFGSSLTFVLDELGSALQPLRRLSLRSSGPAPFPSLGAMGSRDRDFHREDAEGAVRVSLEPGYSLAFILPRADTSSALVLAPSGFVSGKRLPGIFIPRAPPSTPGSMTRVA